MPLVKFNGRAQAIVIILAIAGVPAPPTPILPVTLLPETGTKEFGFGDLAITAGLLLLVLGGISAAIRFSSKD